MNQPADLVSSPEGATFQAEENLLIANHPDAALIATVHHTEQGAVGNIWRRYDDGPPHKLLPERILPGIEVTPATLIGEAMRLGAALDTGTIPSDYRLRLATLGLQQEAIKLHLSEGQSGKKEQKI
ncbi:MAG: hypothetical protein HYS86_04205 [Candidatus Chisholmbacteria bacterium]|nr:hypothetical protein [Candidatus Chisholmbacteria bacterium]